MKLSLASHVSLREYNGKLFAFDKRNNELFELDRDSFNLLEKLASFDVDDLTPDHTSFLNECLREQLLAFGKFRPRIHINADMPIEDAPLYLLLHTTDRCNLECGHCYLGHKTNIGLTYNQILCAINEFQDLAGQTVLVSGGEPLLHPQFWEINDLIESFDLRFELLTNGTLIDQSIADRLLFHEIQISIDGWGPSHDALRGAGSFKKAIEAIEILLDCGKKVSVATMITKHNSNNLHELDSLERFCLSRGIVNWSVNAPCDKGDWVSNKQKAIAKVDSTIEIMARYGYGEGQHDFGLKHACGGNLCTVMANGDIVGCVLATEDPIGSIDRGLAAAWARKNPFLLVQTECVDCEHLTLCRGGCRISALETSGSLNGKDLIQCAAIERYLEKNAIMKGGVENET